MSEKILTFARYIRSKGFFDLLFVNLLTQFLSFGSILLVAKFITPQEFGEIKIIQSYVGIFTIIAGFGFNTAVLKLCSENRPEQEKAGILRLAVLYASISTAIVLILVVFLTLIGKISSLSENNRVWLIIYSLSIPMQVVTSIFIVYLQAQKRIKEMAISQAIIKIQSVLLIILFTWRWGFEGFVISSVVAFALGLWPFLRLIGIKFLFSHLKVKPDLFLKYGLYSFLANGVYQLGQYGDIFILDYFSADRISIGYYSMALIFITAASQVTATVQAITTPYFSEKSNDKTWFRRNLLKNQIRMAFLSVLVAAGVFILAKVLIPAIFGLDYAISISFLTILLIKYVVWSSCAIISTSLIGLGLMHYNLIIVSIVTPISFLFSYALYLQNGIIGVAWAQVFSAAVMWLLLVLAIRLVMRRSFPLTSELSKVNEKNKRDNS